MAVRTFQAWWRFHALSMRSKLARHDSLSRAPPGALTAEPLRRRDNSCHSVCTRLSREQQILSMWSSDCNRARWPRPPPIRCRVELLDAEVGPGADHLDPAYGRSPGRSRWGSGHSLNRSTCAATQSVALRGRSCTARPAFSATLEPPPARFAVYFRARESLHVRRCVVRNAL